MDGDKYPVAMKAVSDMLEGKNLKAIKNKRIPPAYAARGQLNIMQPVITMIQCAQDLFEYIPDSSACSTMRISNLTKVTLGKLISTSGMTKPGCFVGINRRSEYV